MSAFVANHFARSTSRTTNPEINVEVATTAKFTVANLEGDGHLVIGMKLLVKAFARVCLQLNVVRGSNGEQATKGGVEESKDKHDCCCLALCLRTESLQRQQ